MVRSSLLLSLVAAQKLPCQQKAPRNRNSDGKRHWIEELPRKLKLSSSSRSAGVADSCCDGRPYSSSRSQCCFKRIIPNTKTCCITGEVVDRGLTCPCAPSGEWVRVERDRLATLTSAMEQLGKKVAAAAEQNFDQLKKTEETIKRADLFATELGKELCDLLRLSIQDPECRNIETSILEDRFERPQRRVRPRRGVTIHEEVVLSRDYGSSEYGNEYEYEEEYEEYGNAERLNDFVEYDAEPEENYVPQQELIYSLVQKRASLRGEITGGSAALLRSKYLAEQFKHVSSILSSLESPLRESEYIVEALEKTEKSGECSTAPWLSNTSQYLEQFKDLQLLVDQLYQEAGARVLAGQSKWIADKYSELAYWHERHDRANQNYDDYIDEEYEYYQS